MRARTGQRRIAAIALALLGLVGPARAGAPEPPESELEPAAPIAARTSPAATPPRQALDPSARLLSGDEASEAWTLFIDLESGHRITQRFLLSNAGPGEHNAVAVGHLIEPGRAPYRYQNGRRRPRWTLSDDRLFFDIAASHLDLHRPRGELRITKEDIEIRLFFEFPADSSSARVPANRLPPGYHVDLLAAAAKIQGTIEAPWMTAPVETQGRVWLVHTWSQEAEASLLDRRVEIYGGTPEAPFYGVHVRRGDEFHAGWHYPIIGSGAARDIDSTIHVEEKWNEIGSSSPSDDAGGYAIPSGFEIAGQDLSLRITLAAPWLRFDPLAVIPQPFRWFIRRKTNPQEVWADARIGGTISGLPGNPPLPLTGRTESGSNSKRETDEETANRSVTGVASITFLNPSNRR